MSSNSFIPLSIPNLGAKELEYVTEAVTDGWVSSVGPHVDKFEKEFAKYTTSKYAIACVNGTAAIHIALLLAGVKEGEEVIAPNLTFVAPLNAIRYCNAHPVLMDSEWSTLGMDMDKLESFLSSEVKFIKGEPYNKNTNRRIAAILPMHTLGYPVNIDKLLELAEKYNVKVVEDATESLGSEYKGVKTGNFGLVNCFSFNGNKIMTTGGGGMIVTNDEEIAKKAKHLTTTAKTDPTEYDHDQIGYNYRMVNVLAALGLGQLEQMNRFVEVKRRNILKYIELLGENEDFHFHTEPTDSKSNYWMYSLLIRDTSKYNVPGMIEHFAKFNIQTRPVWKLMNMLPMYKDVQSYQCDVSKDIYNRLVSVPCSTSLTDDEIERVVGVIKSLSV